MRSGKGCLLTVIIGIVNLLIGCYILDSMFGDFQFPTIKGFLYKELTEKPKKTNSGKNKHTTQSKGTKKSVKRENNAKSIATTPIKQDTTIAPKDTATADTVLIKYLEKGNIIKQEIIKIYLKAKNQDTTLTDKKSIYYIEAEKYADSLLLIRVNQLIKEHESKLATPKQESLIIDNTHFGEPAK